MADSFGVFFFIFLVGCLVGICFGIAWQQHVDSQQKCNLAGEKDGGKIATPTNSPPADNITCTAWLGEDDMVMQECKRG